MNRCDRSFRWQRTARWLRVLLRGAAPRRRCKAHASRQSSAGRHKYDWLATDFCVYAQRAPRPAWQAAPTGPDRARGSQAARRATNACRRSAATAISTARLPAPRLPAVSSTRQRRGRGIQTRHRRRNEKTKSKATSRLLGAPGSAVTRRSRTAGGRERLVRHRRRPGKCLRSAGTHPG